MKKIVSCLLVLICCFSVLCGCEGNQQNNVMPYEDLVKIIINKQETANFDEKIIVTGKSYNLKYGTPNSIDTYFLNLNNISLTNNCLITIGESANALYFLYKDILNISNSNKEILWEKK